MISLLFICFRIFNDKNNCGISSIQVSQYQQIAMSYTVESLYDLSLNTFCNPINDDVLKYIMEFCPPTIVLNVLWKNLCVNSGNNKFVDNCTLRGKRNGSTVKGSKLATLNEELKFDSNMASIIICDKLNNAGLEEFIQEEQIQFEDKCHFYKYFDLNLFFKLVKISESRNKLYILFQICVRNRGLKFSTQLATEWVRNKIEEEDYIYDFSNVIKQGLELGIFLGDTGWFTESSSVLSYTYHIICNRWVCPDENLKLIRSSQCLTKWLLVLLNCYNLDEAMIVLQHILKIISIIEKIEGRTLSIPYLYYAVSQYYYTIMYFDKAWSWAVKSINELQYECDTLTPLVMSNAIKICGVMNKISKGLKLIHQLYTYGKKMDHNIIIDIFMNQTCYFLRTRSISQSDINYHIALDTVRNVFGYYNLRTAIVFLNYAQIICNFEYELKVNDALPAIIQALRIMRQLELPDDNMLIVLARQIATQVLPKHVYKTIDPRKVYQINSALSEARVAHFQALEMALKIVGEKSLITAKAYCNLGRIYLNETDYVKAEEMYLKAIKIKESILGRDHPKVAFCLDLLLHLYMYKLFYFPHAIHLCYRTIKIYNTSNEVYQVRMLKNNRNLERLFYYTVENGFRTEFLQEMMVENDVTIPELFIFKLRGQVDILHIIEDDFNFDEFKNLINS